MSVTLKVNKITNSVKRIQRKLDKVPQEAYKEFVKNTPVKTGNARRNTKLRGDTIEANYQYAQVLDKGRHMTRRGMRGSDQAPQGMTKPTEDFIKKRVSQIIKAK
jgi:hypothetical protein